MISYKDLFQFGTVKDGVLQIQNSFSIDREFTLIDCMLLRALSRYEGESAPKIRFTLTVEGIQKPIYISHLYRIGKVKEYTLQTWRVPAFPREKVTLTVNFNIPDGTVLYIRDLGTSSDNGAKDWTGGPRFNAHLGFLAIAPNNTMPAFELAAASGFPACIAVPKVTKDGVLVCIHDDTINKTARDKDGNPPSETIYVCDKTYEELLEWEYGSYRSKVYTGAKIPLLSEFFDLCAKTGMRPMFSTHPALTVDQWHQVKDMLIKRGLLKNFHVKSFELDVLKTAYSVFGEEIDGYTLDVPTWDEALIGKLLGIGFDLSACRVGFEFKFDSYTEEIAKKIIDAGLFAAAWEIERRDFEEYEPLLKWGVTEFTEDNHCSMGLNY